MDTTSWSFARRKCFGFRRNLTRVTSFVWLCHKGPTDVFVLPKITLTLFLFLLFQNHSRQNGVGLFPLILLYVSVFISFCIIYILFFSCVLLEKKRANKKLNILKECYLTSIFVFFFCCLLSLLCYLCHRFSGVNRKKVWNFVISSALFHITLSCFFFLYSCVS